MACGLIGAFALCVHDGASARLFGQSTKKQATDQKLIRQPGMRDPEGRLRPLSDSGLDLTALEGMPQAYIDAMSEYSEAILMAIRAEPLTRKRFYHDAIPGDPIYPFSVNPVYDRDVVIPVVIVPRPNVVVNWSGSTQAKRLGWRSEEEAFSNPQMIYGRSVIFDSGENSKSPLTTLALPYEGGLSAGLFRGDTLLRLGKVVSSPVYDGNGKLVDVIAGLDCGNEGGATVLGQLITVPVCSRNSRLRWASVQRGDDVHRFLAYVLVDGNGPIRERSRLTSDRVSSFVRPLKCSKHQPRIRQHDLLLLPTPTEWPPTHQAASKARVDRCPHEDWCLDDWFHAQPDACWVLRLAEDSKPLQESFLLMPASEKSDRSVFLIVVFAETAPKQLITELAALYNVPSAPVLDSNETMRQISLLYKAVSECRIDE